MRSLLSHPIIILLVIVLAGVFFISLDQNGKRAENSNQEIVKLETEVAQIGDDVKQLESDLEIAERPVTREKVIRNELLMQKEGEYVFQLPEIEVVEEEVEVEEPLTPWQEWQLVLFE